jgi:hypothetical protein
MHAPLKTGHTTEPVPCKGAFWEPTLGPLPAEARCSVCKQLAVLHPHRHVSPIPIERNKT